MFKGIRRGGKVYRKEHKRKERLGDILNSIYWGNIDDYEKTEKWLQEGNDPNEYLEGYGSFLSSIFDREYGFDNSIELVQLLLKYNVDPFLYYNETESLYDICVKGTMENKNHEIEILKLFNQL